MGVHIRVHPLIMLLGSGNIAKYAYNYADSMMKEREK